MATMQVKREANISLLYLAPCFYLSVSSEFCQASEWVGIWFAGVGLEVPGWRIVAFIIFSPTPYKLEFIEKVYPESLGGTVQL